MGFRYPTNLRGGGLIWQTVAATLPQEWIRLNEKVEAIDPKKRSVGL